MQLIPQKKRWRKVGKAVGLLLTAYVIMCTYSAYNYIHPARAKITRPSWVKEVEIPGSKALIPSWVSPGLANGKGKSTVFVLAYGYGGTRESFTDLTRKLPKMGFECVVPCMPGQEASKESSVEFGYAEARTIIDSVKWVRSQYKKQPKIVLYGVSMGGAATWLASEMDPSVDAVITEGAYAQFDKAMDNWLNQKLPGSSFYLKPMVWIASAMDHIDPSKIVPSDSAAKWRKPALVIQGSEDKLIPMWNATKLSDAAKCPIWVVPGAVHAHCYETAMKEYLNRLADVANHA